MLRTYVQRIATVCASVALVVAAAGSAQASNQVFKLVKSGEKRGHVTFIDNGDKFEVCDTNADGHGVYIQLLAVAPQGATIPLMSGVDGGDTPCGTFHYDIKKDAPYGYFLVLTWNGKSSSWHISE